MVIAAHTSSTEVGIYERMDELSHEVIRHSPPELHSLLTPAEQGRYRFKSIIEAFSVLEYDISNVDIVVTEMACPTLLPGIYMVDEPLLELQSDSVIEENQYRSGVFAAHFLCQHINECFDRECMPIAVEPAMDNEILPKASLSGIKGVTRAPRYKALSQRAAATFYAWQNFGKTANEIQAVIGVCAFDMGRIIDNNCTQEGEGPFSPSSSGTLPMDALLDLCYSGKYDMDEIITMITRRGGLAAYLDDPSLDNVMKEYRACNKKVTFLVEVMAASVAREIGARAAALCGQVNAIILAGQWVQFDELIGLIKQRVDWIAPLKVLQYRGELMTLSLSGQEVFRGRYKISRYGSDRT